MLNEETSKKSQINHYEIFENQSFILSVLIYKI